MISETSTHKFSDQMKMYDCINQFIASRKFDCVVDEPLSEGELAIWLRDADQNVFFFNSLGKSVDGVWSLEHYMNILPKHYSCPWPATCK